MENLNGQASQSNEARIVDLSLHGALGWADFPETGLI